MVIHKNVMHTLKTNQHCLLAKEIQFISGRMLGVPPLNLETSQDMLTNLGILLFQKVEDFFADGTWSFPSDWTSLFPFLQERIHQDLLI